MEMKEAATMFIASVIISDRISDLIEEVIDLAGDLELSVRPLLLSLKDSVSQIIDKVLEAGEIEGSRIK